MEQTTNLLDEIYDIAPHSRVLFLTYKYNQYFFEKYIFSPFKNKALPLILLDYTEYQAALKDIEVSRLAETRYLLESIKLDNATFHSKLVISCSNDEMKIIISSANLTTQGYANNAEICTVIDIPSNDKNKYPIILSVINFLIDLKSFVKSDVHRTEIDKLIAKIELPKEFEEIDPNFYFIHNIKESILGQVNKIIKEKIVKVIIICPYFSANIEFYKRFAKEFTDGLIFIVQQKNNTLPVRELSKWNKHKNFKYYLINFKQNRSLHGKIFLFYTKSGIYCLTGSANFSDKALLMTAVNGGNIETCILRKEKDLKYFNYLLKSEGLTVKEISLDAIESEETPLENSSKISDFCIIEAKVKGNILIIRLDKVISEKAKLRIYIDRLGREIDIEAASNEIIVELNNEDLVRLSTSSKVSIEIASEDRILKSDQKLIHNPQYFPDQFSMLSGIMDESERIWLFKILNRYSNLPTFNYIFPILDRMEEYGLFETENSTKEELLLKLQNKFLKASQQPYSTNEQLSQVIERFRKRHEKRVESAIRNKDADNIQVVVDSFVIINKLILWSVYKNIENIFYLSKIRGHIDDLKRGYLSLLIKKGKNKEIEESRLLYHLLSLAYAVDYLQNNSEEFKKMYNQRTGRNYVKEAIDEAFKNAIFSVKRLCNMATIDIEKLEDVIKEYNEIIPISTTPKEVILSIKNRFKM